MGVLPYHAHWYKQAFLTHKRCERVRLRGFGLSIVAVVGILLPNALRHAHDQCLGR